MMSAKLVILFIQGKYEDHISLVFCLFWACEPAEVKVETLDGNTINESESNDDNGGEEGSDNSNEGDDNSGSSGGNNGGNGDDDLSQLEELIDQLTEECSQGRE